MVTIVINRYYTICIVDQKSVGLDISIFPRIARGGVLDNALTLLRPQLTKCIQSIWLQVRVHCVTLTCTYDQKKESEVSLPVVTHDLRAPEIAWRVDGNAHQYTFLNDKKEVC